MMFEWTFVICIVIGAAAGSLVTAVILLDHRPPETKRKGYEE